MNRLDYAEMAWKRPQLASIGRNRLEQPELGPVSDNQSSLHFGIPNNKLYNVVVRWNLFDFLNWKTNICKIFPKERRKRTRNYEQNIENCVTTTFKECIYT